MSNTKTTIINLYGGPCSGKSTAAAYLYYLLKTRGDNVELVREYIKDWVWEARKFNKYDQFYFLGKQIRQETLLYGKVDWIITDAPVMMNLYYTHKFCPAPLAAGLQEAALSFYNETLHDGHKSIHIFLNRHKPYLTHGRYQTEEEAKKIDLGVKDLLNQLNIPFVESTSEEASLIEVLNNIK